MRSVLDFLYDLSLHNDSEWFNANKARYIEANNTFNVFAMQLAARLADVDPQIGRQQLKDMTYRIYRDVRSRRTRCRTRHISVPLYAGEGRSHHTADIISRPECGERAISKAGICWQS